jgi:hypothetical protein
MGNVFSGGGRDLHLSNGSTEVLVSVLLLATSNLVRRPWDCRFTLFLARQDQTVAGLGAVGFDLEDIDWGDTEPARADATDFVLRSLDLALSRHRWDELGYDPPFVEGQLREFREMVAGFDPATAAPRGFPTEQDIVGVASCVRHRVLSALPDWSGCLFCGIEGLPR